MNAEQPQDMSEVSSPAEDQNLPAATLEGELQAITAERDKLAAEQIELCDRLLRKQAEFDNYKKRMEREKAEYVLGVKRDAGEGRDRK